MAEHADVEVAFLNDRPPRNPSTVACELVLKGMATGLFFMYEYVPLEDDDETRTNNLSKYLYYMSTSVQHSPTHTSSGQMRIFCCAIS